MPPDPDNGSINRIKIAFLDVGQGDTTVISSPDTAEAIVIDCVNAEAVLSYLQAEQIRHLRGVVITHLHMDHYAGVALLLNDYLDIPGMQDEVLLIVNPIKASKQTNLPTSAFHDAHDEDYAQPPPAGGSRKAPLALDQIIQWGYKHPERFGQLTLGGNPGWLPGYLAQSVRPIHPYTVDWSDLLGQGLNNTSICIRVQTSGASALLLGDLEPAGWQTLVNRNSNNQVLQSDLLKFPHHGGWHDSDAVNHLLQEVDPSVVVVSVGTTGEKYQHPNKLVLQAIRERHTPTRPIRILCTQGTKLCRMAGFSNDPRANITAQLQAQATANASWLFAPSGCPCAGTVVVELYNGPRKLDSKIGLFKVESEYDNEASLHPRI